MVHSTSSGSLQGVGAGGFRYVSQTPSTGSLTGMVHSGSNGSLNGLQQVSSTNSLPIVTSTGSLTSMPMQQIPQHGWFGNFTNTVFTSDANSPRPVQPTPIYCFDNPAQQKAAVQNHQAATPDGTVPPRQQPDAMSLFVSGFPMVSPHGVMAPVQQVMVSTNTQSFTPDNNMTGMPRSDSSLSLNSLGSQHSDDGGLVPTQYSLTSLASSDGGSTGFPLYYTPAMPFASYQPAPHQQQQQYHNANPNYSSYQPQPHQQHQQHNSSPKGYSPQYQQYQDPNQNFQQYQQPPQHQMQHQWNGGRSNQRKEHDSRRDGRHNYRQQQRVDNFRQRRNRRSKHQPPRFNDPEACKCCRTKQKFLKFKKKFSVGDVCAILQVRNVDENMVPETFGERWDVSEFFQVVDFFDVSRLNEYEYFKVPRTHTDENEVVNSHMLIEIFGRQLGFRRNQIPKRFKPVSIHDVSGCDARTAVRHSINEGLQSWAKRYNVHIKFPNFQNKLSQLLHRYVGCQSMVELCGETLPDLWTGFADSKLESQPNSVIRWTYYFLVTWDNYHLFVEETKLARDQTAV